MAHLEGVLTLVSTSGPWFRIQGKHVREATAKPFGFRLSVDPSSGVTVDLHVRAGLWVRAGWYPSHQFCTVHTSAINAAHRCWANRLAPRVYEHGIA